jgi:hypothetical protein
LNVVLVNQDEQDGKRTLYLQEIKSAMEDLNVDFVLIDKSNLDPKNLDDLKTVGVTDAFYIEYFHPEGIDALKALCAERIVSRKGHRSLVKKVVAEVLEILDKMLSFYVPHTRPVHRLSVLEEPETAVHIASSVIGFDFTCDEINEAVKESKLYEEEIGDEKQKIKFGSIEVSPELMKTLLEQVPPEALFGKKIQKKFHITVRYLKTLDPVWYVKFSKMIGQKTIFEVFEIVWDDRVVAMRVRGDFECANEIPHITIAFADGVKPFESNAMLARGGTGKVILDVPVSTTGVYKAN